MDPYYQDDAVTLYHGRAEEGLPCLPPQSIDLILTDPPYYRTKLDYAGEKLVWDRQWKSESAYLDWLRGLCIEWHRVLKPNGSLYVFASPRMATPEELVIREHFHVLNRITWLKEAGWHKKTEKEELRSYLSPWEAIVFAEQWLSDNIVSKEAGYEEASRLLHKQVYAPIGNYIRTERERSGHTRDNVDVALGYVRTKNPERGTELCRRWEEGSSLPTKEAYERLRTFLNNGHTFEYLRQEYEDLRQEYEDLRRPFALTARDQYTDVWTFAPVQASPGKHPCQKPLALLEHMIRVSSKPGAMVLDCCAGSGATLDACKRLGRKGIGMEMEEKWCRRAARRLSQEVFRWGGNKDKDERHEQ